MFFFPHHCDLSYFEYKRKQTANSLGVVPSVRPTPVASRTDNAIIIIIPRFKENAPCLRPGQKVPILLILLREVRLSPSVATVKRAEPSGSLDIPPPSLTRSFSFLYRYGHWRSPEFLQLGENAARALEGSTVLCGVSLSRLVGPCPSFPRPKDGSSPSYFQALPARFASFRCNKAACLFTTITAPGQTCTSSTTPPGK